MEQTVQAYIKSLETGEKSEHTIRAYRNAIEKMLSHFNFKSPIEIEATSSVDWQNFYSQTGLAPKSLNALILRLSVFFTFMEDNGIISKENGFRKVRFGKSKLVKEKKIAKFVLTDEESKKIIMAHPDIQVRFMIALMITTGLRRDEVAQIRVEDVQKDGSIIINGKGGKQRRTYMSPVVHQMYSLYMSQRDTDTPYLFYGTRGETSGKLTGESINNRVKKAVELSGIDKERNIKITAHRIRATAITNVIRKHGIHAAQKYAGHQNVETTYLYDGTGDEVTRGVIMEDDFQIEDEN